MQIRQLVAGVSSVRSSVWAIAEFHGVLHRHIRERNLDPTDAKGLSLRFSTHLRDGLWVLAPVEEMLLRRTGALLIEAPDNRFLRTADAVHLATASELGEAEIWTNDRHMLAAAPYFGLQGRSVY